ncbi:hypothetical protein ASD62_14870 [Phycicoccus sp. Root563]|nr:MFS transporter [Phycicoccus sp. Root563]KQZ90376.1 hypothetical protein ASD62_14870 [Phycicoccus sp. Root563]
MSSRSVPSGSPDRRARRARWATAAMFATNGAVFANVVPRYPDIVARLHLDEAAFGTAVAGYGLGAVLAGLVAAALVNRFGSARVAVGGTLAVAANLVLVGAAPSWLLLALALALAGALDSVTDISENAQGLRVERHYGRSILNSMHATWSIGAVVGGAMGSAAAGLGVPLVPHLAVAAATAIALALLVRTRLLPGPDPDPSPTAAAVARPRRAAVAAAGDCWAGCSRSPSWARWPKASRTSPRRGARSTCARTSALRPWSAAWGSWPSRDCRPSAGWSATVRSPPGATARWRGPEQHSRLRRWGWRWSWGPRC